MRHLTASLLATSAVALLAASALAGGDGTQRLSVGSAAQQGDGFSARGGLSASGRHVAFTSGRDQPRAQRRRERRLAGHPAAGPPGRHD